MYYNDIIKQSVQDTKVWNSQQRRKKIEKLIDYYEGGTNSTKYIKRYFDTDLYKEIPLYCVNMTKPIIDKLSRVYKHSPIRSVGGNPTNPRYEPLVKSLNLFNKNLERMLRLLDVVAVGVSWDEINNKFVHNAIYYFDAFFNDTDPYNPTAICYPLLSPTGDTSYTNISKWVYFDSEVKVVYDENGNTLSEEPHSLGRLPFVFPRVNMQIDDFYGEGATDVISVNEHINITFTEMQLGLRFQMFGFPYVTGMDDETPIQRIGPDKIMQFPENTNFGIASTSLNIDQVMNNIKFQAEMLGKSRHLSVTFESSQDRPSSALALIIKDQDRMEHYKDDVEYFRIYEHELYELQKIVAKNNAIYLPDEFTIDFTEPIYPSSVQEQIMRDEWDLSQGFVSKEELLVRKRGDISIDDAKNIIKANDNGKEANRDTIRPEV